MGSDCISSWSSLIFLVYISKTQKKGYHYWIHVIYSMMISNQVLRSSVTSDISTLQKKLVTILKGIHMKRVETPTSVFATLYVT